MCFFWLPTWVPNAAMRGCGLAISVSDLQGKPVICPIASESERSEIPTCVERSSHLLYHHCRLLVGREDNLYQLKFQKILFFLRRTSPKYNLDLVE